ncbi:hypothetical protein Ocin01_12425 [Orchesella cincta]|uniref:Uncharacterized protein n=1 Tax=Orchesella cincta TaxID=48709 RepID=A0A1D2MMG4_ORCCI|nr:hypothetical protein Ocin01_12425 [Orchesella cincta]
MEVAKNHGTEVGKDKHSDIEIHVDTSASSTPIGSSLSPILTPRRCSSCSSRIQLKYEEMTTVTMQTNDSRSPKKVQFSEVTEIRYIDPDDDKKSKPQKRNGSELSSSLKSILKRAKLNAPPEDIGGPTQTQGDVENSNENCEKTDDRSRPPCGIQTVSPPFVRSSTPNVIDDEETERGYLNHITEELVLPSSNNSPEQQSSDVYIDSDSPVRTRMDNLSANRIA